MQYRKVYGLLEIMLKTAALFNIFYNPLAFYSNSSLSNSTLSDLPIH